MWISIISPVTFLLMMHAAVSHNRHDRKFVKTDMTSSLSLQGCAIVRRRARSHIDCSAACAERPECTTYGYDKTNRDCIVGINDSGADLDFQLNLDSGQWVVFTNTYNIPPPTTNEGTLDTGTASIFEWYKTSTTYHLVTTEMTWSQAQSHCVSLHHQAHLATMETNDEYRFIMTNLDSAELNTFLWLGGRSDVKDGGWRWITNETWQWTNWAAGQPSGEADEMCLAMFPSGNSFAGQFHDFCCNEEFPFICEREDG